LAFFPRPARAAGRIGGEMDTGNQSEYVTSADALAILGVKPQTLYSYVSRGFVRRMSVDRKTCLYNRDDIRRLKTRSVARSGHGPVAGGALQWGEPVLVTGITEITANGPRYRGHLATELARDGYSFESVAEYLWNGGEIDRSKRWEFDSSLLGVARQVGSLAGAYPGIHLRQLLTEIVLLLGIERTQGHPDRQSTSIAEAPTLVQALCTAFGFVGTGRRFVAPHKNETVAAYILRALGLEADTAQVRVLNTVLVLLADHEFSPATFAARIAASSGVDLHSCIGAALHVHFGSALGLRCDRIENALKMQATNRSDALDVPPLGFGHPLYAEKDPRATDILDLALGLKDHTAATEDALARLRRLDDHGGAVSLDAALVVVCRALGIKAPVAAGLLVVSRCAGWIAHVFEQYQQDFMIRPRGKFKTAIPPADQNVA
jgi:citrate synthase